MYMDEIQIIAKKENELKTHHRQWGYAVKI